MPSLLPDTPKQFITRRPERRMKVVDLVTHTAGLTYGFLDRTAVDAGYRRLKVVESKTEGGLDRMIADLARLPLEFSPGTQWNYSVAMDVMGYLVQKLSGQTFGEFLRTRLFEPLGMKDTTYLPGPELLPRIAPTENDPWRGHVLRGEVHDENAAALGGIAPHAGLFGTAPDLARFAQMLLNGGVYEQKRIVSRETIERFTKRQGVPDSSRALGWDTPSENSSAGSLFGPRSFGHTGFTGTSMWMDPDRTLFVILLTNRVHPTRENNAIREVRRAVADAVVRGLAQP
jgi:CubicO group peptidase (beta-lactamase class C family)